METKGKSKISFYQEVKPFIIPVLVVFLILVSGFFLLKPKIVQILDSRNEVKKKEEKLAQLTAKLAALNGLDKSELTRRAEVVLRALPEEKNLPLLLMTVRSLAAEKNLELLGLSVSPGELSTVSAELKKDNLPALSFQIQLKGSLKSVEELLSEVDKAAPLVKIEKLGLGSEKGVDLYEITLSLDSYFLFLPKNLGIPEKPLNLINKEEENIYSQLTHLEILPSKEQFILLPAGRENPFVF